MLQFALMFYVLVEDFVFFAKKSFGEIVDCHKQNRFAASIASINTLSCKIKSKALPLYR